MNTSLSRYFPELALRRLSSLESEITLDHSKNSKNEDDTLENKATSKETKEKNLSKSSVDDERDIKFTSSAKQNAKEILHESKNFDDNFDDIFDPDLRKDEEISDTIDYYPVIMLDLFCFVSFLLISFIIFISSFIKTSTSTYNISHPRMSPDQNISRLSSPTKGITQLCDSRFIASGNGFEICENACKIAKCCFLTNEGLKNQSCINEEHKNITCALYVKPCSPIFNTTDEDRKKDSNEFSAKQDNGNVFSLENLCSLENLKDESSKKICFEACSPARCCFLSENSCETNYTATWCKMFSQCAKIFDSN